MPKYSVAVRPTPDQVKRGGLFYDPAYYEDRARVIDAKTPAIAAELYVEYHRSSEDRPDVGIKRGDLVWLTKPEIPFLKAFEVKIPDNVIVDATRFMEDNAKSTAYVFITNTGDYAISCTRHGMYCYVGCVQETGEVYLYD